MASNYSYEEVRKKIGSTRTVGGPPLNNIDVGSTLYNQVQQSIDYTTANQPYENLTSLGKATVQAEINDKPPFSCMRELLTGKYSLCGSKIPEHLKKSAFKVFTQVTGFEPLNLDQALMEINYQEKMIVQFTSLYVFLPMVLIITMAIWLLVLFSFVPWAAGIYLTLFSFIIIYGFSVAYRYHSERWLNNRNALVERELSEYQTNYEDSIAYWPQGLYAVAGCITATGGTGGWSCNKIVKDLSKTKHVDKSLTNKDVDKSLDKCLDKTLDNETTNALPKDLCKDVKVSKKFKSKNEVNEKSKKKLKKNK